MGMAAAFRIDRNVIEIIDPRDVKGDVIAALDKGQIAPWVVDLRQVDLPNKPAWCRHALASVKMVMYPSRSA